MLHSESNTSVPRTRTVGRMSVNASLSLILFKSKINKTSQARAEKDPFGYCWICDQTAHGLAVSPTFESPDRPARNELRRLAVPPHHDATELGLRPWLAAKPRRQLPRSESNVSGTPRSRRCSGVRLSQYSLRPGEAIHAGTRQLTRMFS